MTLRHLFDAALKHNPEVDTVVDAEGRDGVLIGNGDGRVEGPELRGRILWSFYEDVGETVCRTNPGGRIETEDGARIAFDAVGYAVRHDPSETTWKLTSSLRFETEDERYAWLNGALGVWEGRFDQDLGTAGYRAYVFGEADR